MNIDRHRSGRQPKWSASLTDFEDVGCITCWLPCITFGRIAEVVDEGKSSCVAQVFVYGCLMLVQCHWLTSCMYREKLRSKFGLPEDPCCDCCVHFCCEPCALLSRACRAKTHRLGPLHRLYHSWIGPPNAPPPLQMPPSMYK